MKISEQINELAASLAKAQLELSNPKKTSVNSYFKTKYADLSAVINISKPVLAEHGLSIVQLLTYSEQCIKIETILLHASGQFISEALAIPVTKADSQGLGSAATYGRRYAWAAICGLAQEDDDGNLASEPVTQQKIVILDDDFETWEIMKDEFRKHGDIKKIFKKYDLTDDQINRLYEENDSI